MKTLHNFWKDLHYSHISVLASAYPPGRILIINSQELTLKLLIPTVKILIN
jgi:hypothetical protein